MSDIILQTKLYQPALRSSILARPRLFEKIDQGSQGKLILVVAPAGYGKTTLVAAWAAQLAQRRVAWLTLDGNDNDAQTFWGYLLAAIRPFAPQLAEELNAQISAGQPSVSQLIPPLLNGLAEMPESLIIVLDDFHVIDNPAIQEGIAQLLDYLPPNVQFVLTTRRDPALPLARYRVRGEMVEIRLADLKLDTAESAQFLGQSMGLELSEEDIGILAERTEGWIASLQLAALSLRDLDRPQERKQFIQTFGGSHRYVADYLLDEVLSHWPPDTRDFLLKISILPRFNGALVEQMTEGKAGQAFLEQLDEANFLLISLDERREWFRYHHLLATLLQQRLVKSLPEQIGSLYRQGIRWFEEGGFLAEAIELALQGQMYQEALRLLAQIAQTAVWQRGDYVRLAHWLDQLPQEILAQHPQICVYYAWGLLVDANRSDAAAAAHYLALAETSSAGASAEERDIRGQIATIRAIRTRVAAHIEQTITLVDFALDHLGAESKFWRANAYFNLAAVYFLGDDDSATEEMLKKSAEALAGSADNMMVMPAKNMGGQLLVRQGQLQDARRMFEEARDYEQRHPQRVDYFTAGMSLLGLGALYREWNELEQAADLLRRGLAIGRQNHHPLTLIAGQIALADLLLAMGDKDGAVALIREATSTSQSTGVKWTWLNGPVPAACARLWLRMGEPAKAREALITYQAASGDQPGRSGYWDECWQLAKARLLMAEQKWQEASTLLLDLAGRASAAKRIGSQITILVPLALTYERLGQRDDAVWALTAAVILGRPSGYMRLFLDEGQALADLMVHLPERMPGHRYRDQLITAFGEPVATVDQSALIEPLTERELQIVRLMAARLSNREIGEALFLATTTIKWYSSQIYGKLGVNNRREAAQKAKALGLI